MPITADKPPAAQAAAPAPSDAELLARVRDGDTDAYADIVRRYNRRLFRAARSVAGNDADAQDAMQEAYVRAFLALEGFDRTGSLGAWLTRITVNEALMKKRRERRLLVEEDPYRHPRALPGAGGAAGPESELARTRLRERLEAAIDALPAAFRTVFVLRALEQLSVRETASSLDIPEATVKTRFHRARRLVRAALSRDIDAVDAAAFDFAGARCEAMVERVRRRLSALHDAPGRPRS